MLVSEQAGVFKGAQQASVLARLCGRQAALCGEKLETSKHEPIGATFGTVVHRNAALRASKCFDVNLRTILRLTASSPVS